MSYGVITKMFLLILAKGVFDSGWYRYGRVIARLDPLTGARHICVDGAVDVEDPPGNIAPTYHLGNEKKLEEIYNNILDL